MNKLFFSISMIVFHFSFFAYSIESVTKIENNNKTITNLHKGNYELDGGFNWTQKTGSRSTDSDFTVSASLKYFFIDKFSSGGIISYSDVTTRNPSRTIYYTSIGFGPSISYYFFEHSNIATYFSQSIIMKKYSDYEKYLFDGISTLGIKFFILPEIAFGFDLTHKYDLDRVKSRYPVTSMNGKFSLYF